MWPELGNMYSPLGYYICIHDLPNTSSSFLSTNQHHLTKKIPTAANASTPPFFHLPQPNHPPLISTIISTQLSSPSMQHISSPLTPLLMTPLLISTIISRFRSITISGSNVSKTRDIRKIHI